ncbi:DNA glycosylase [Hypoxylon argillaceum]|nr:DNA glycosylase [Hypoxylon argillaceum]
MARTTRSNAKTKVADEPATRRRSARHAALEINEAMDERVIKDENSERKSENENQSKVDEPPRAKTKRALTDSLPPADLQQSKRVKSDDAIKQDEQVKEEKDGEIKIALIDIGKRCRKPGKTRGATIANLPPASPHVKPEPEADNDAIINSKATNAVKTATATTKVATAEEALQAKKLKSYTQFAAARQSPYPDFAHPTIPECKRAHQILTTLHGARTRPETTLAPPSRAGCGDSASVLDALVRTILSQNTSDANSARAKRAMDATYGSSSAWAAIASGGAARLAKAIESGGLAGVKARAIVGVLAQTRERYGAYSLDHLFGVSDEEAMRELLAFRGVGPKTASCVLLFCLRRASFAVDTHVHRITGWLGWRPAAATRDQTHAHLDARIPDEDKYGLHVLMVRHGKECVECRAGGKSLGRCELRRAFGKGKGKGKGKGVEEDGELVKEEEKVWQIKAEEDDGVDYNDVKG